MMSFNADGSSCRNCCPESRKTSGMAQEKFNIYGQLTPYKLEKQFDLKLRQVFRQKSTNDVEDKERRDDLEIIEFGNQDEQVGTFFAIIFACFTRCRG